MQYYQVEKAEETTQVLNTIIYSALQKTLDSVANTSRLAKNANLKIINKYKL